MDMPSGCLKSYNPYDYCPLLFKNEDDFISQMLEAAMHDIKRLAGLEQTLSGEEAVMLDSRCKELTAYMNGRIHELVRVIKELKDDSILKKLESIESDIKIIRRRTL